MLRKIWAISWKELYTTFTDRNLILIMIVTPLALATIIGVAFSGFISTSRDVPISDISVAVVNLDEGAEANGETINNGDIYVNLLVPRTTPDPDNPLHQLTNASRVSSAERARAGVDSGEYAAAIIIPPDFSTNLTYTQGQGIEQAAVEVYASPVSPVSAAVVRSIVESIGNQIATGNITIEATIEALIEQAQDDPAFGLRFAAEAASGEFQPDFSAAFTPGENPIRIEQQTVTGEAATFSPLVVFGSAQAVFFMLFTAMAGASDLLEERRTGTLQRLIVSPTPRIVILLGKLFGTLVTCIVQVTLLVIALTIVGSLIAGEIQFIWGSNLLGVAGVIVAVSVAAAGLATLIAGLVQTAEQGNTIGGVISIAMGVLGGAFFGTAAFPEAIKPLTKLTITYWGTDAFTLLAQNQDDIGTHLLVLMVMGVVLFTAGLVAFNRRLSI